MIAREDRDILIAGAGPTGLMLALQLARRGVPFRLISGAAGPGEHSRAMMVNARSLEFYDQFGLADSMVQQGIILHAAHLRAATASGSREVVSFTFGQLGEGISPYPYALVYPQDDHERFLVRALADSGGRVEWNTTLLGFTQDGNGVQATLRTPDGSEQEVRAGYVCGCDGAHSRVRQTLGIGFPGGTYDQLFYVADVQIEGASRTDLVMNLGEQSLVLLLPVRSSGMHRLIGLVRPELSTRDDLTFDDVRTDAEALIGLRVGAVNWFSHYRVHHRVAERFQVGRAFLLGDAGHIHSPVGGQGMNTGLGDAVNLGWKLAAVQQGRATPDLLDSYEAERIGFARQLVDTTDRVFTPMVAQGLLGELTRRVVAPLFLAVASRFAATRHMAFRTLSQTQVHYEHSPLSQGQAGHVHGGDRLPWTGDNYPPLRTMDWQVHVYGAADPALRPECEALGLTLHQFEFSDGARHAGMATGAAYLVRPDGYVALAASAGAATALRAYASQHGLRFGTPA